MAAPTDGISRTVGSQDQPRLSARALSNKSNIRSLGMTRSIAKQSGVSNPRGMRDYSRR